MSLHAESVLSSYKHRLCPLCLNDNKEGQASVYSRDLWVLKKCNQCKFVYLENSPDYDAFEETFAWEKTSLVHETARHDNSFRKKLSKAIETYVGQYFKRDKLLTLISIYFNAGNIIDIGCGNGAVIRRLDHKFIPFGIEISKQQAYDAKLIAEARGGGVLNMNALEGLLSFPDAFFDGAVMSAYLEHELNPADVLKAAFFVLKNGCYLIIKVPNYACVNRTVMGRKWCGFRFPDHLNYFTPYSLKKMIINAGFEITKFNIWDKFPTSDNMWLVARKPFL